MTGLNCAPLLLLLVEFTVVAVEVFVVVVLDAFSCCYSSRASSTLVFRNSSRGGANYCSSCFGETFWILMFWPSPNMVLGGSFTREFCWKPFEILLESVMICVFWTPICWIFLSSSYSAVMLEALACASSLLLVAELEIIAQVVPVSSVVHFEVVLWKYVQEIFYEGEDEAVQLMDVDAFTQEAVVPCRSEQLKGVCSTVSLH